MNKRFLTLDSFRGLFAVAVVMFHIHVANSIVALRFFRESSIFVEFFFVLSGFVFAHRYGDRANLSFRNYAIARTFRLFPLHIAMLIVFLILEVGKVIAATQGFIFNYEPFTGVNAVSEILPNLLLIQAWTPLTKPMTFNGPSWSISIEYYMYLIFFITLLFRKRVKGYVWLIISLFAFWLIINNSTLLVNEVQRGISCFFAGSVTYRVYKKISHLKFSYALASFTELLLLILIVWVVSFHFNYKTVIASLLFCLTILFYAFEAGIVSRLLKHAFFLRLGKLSYSIYMVHAALLFVLQSALMVLGKLTGISFTPTIEGVRAITLGSRIANNMLVLGILVTVWYVASLTYKYIELPGQEVGRMLISRNKSATA